jgi:hypothetical protein
MQRIFERNLVMYDESDIPGLTSLFARVLPIIAKQLTELEADFERDQVEHAKALKQYFIDFAAWEKLPFWKRQRSGPSAKWYVEYPRKPVPSIPLRNRIERFRKYIDFIESTAECIRLYECSPLVGFWFYEDMNDNTISHLVYLVYVYEGDL